MKVLFAALLCYLLPACISTGGKEPNVTGIRLGEETLKQFKPKETSERWLVAVIGEPTSKSTVEGADDLHVYRYTTVEESNGMFSFLSGKSSRTTATVYFVIQKGVVIQFWADRVDKTGEKVKD